MTHPIVLSPNAPVFDRAALDALLAADADLTRLLAFARTRTSNDRSGAVPHAPHLGGIEPSAALRFDPGHDLAHCLRVAQWAVALGQPLAVAPREAVAAAAEGALGKN